jgi:hypothetical protein
MSAGIRTKTISHAMTGRIIARALLELIRVDRITCAAACGVANQEA